MKIVVLDGYCLNPGDLSWRGLQAWGEVTVYDRTPPELLLERAAGADVLLTNKTPLGRAEMAELGALRYVGVLATGYNVVDVEAAREQGVVVTNVPTYGTDSVAQLTMALLLELCHQVGVHSAAVRAGEWTASADWSFWKSPQVELAGKTLGCIGYGGGDGDAGGGAPTLRRDAVGGVAGGERCGELALSVVSGNAGNDLCVDSRADEAFGLSVEHLSRTAGGGTGFSRCSARGNDCRCRC